MPEAVDVGSVLGGRYKVTAYVLASAEKDLVLDGVDQVLNRPVSILVASAGNASQVATSARELATGDRNGNIQVLDLGITDSDTYLVTNRAPAADMLDLIVQQETPAQDAPYVEPFFTDTLGSEIFGRPRSTEPETYDGEYEEYDDGQQHRTSRFAGLARRFGRQGSGEDRGDDTSDLPVSSEPEAGPQQSSHRVPPPPSQRPAGTAAGGPAAPLVPSEEWRDQEDDADQHRQTPTAGAAGAGAAGAAAGMASQHPERTTSHDPSPGHDDDFDMFDDPDSYDQDGDDSRGRTFTRVLVGAVLAVVLVGAVILASTQLSSIFSGTTVAGGGGSQATSDSPAEAAPTAPTTAATEPVQAAVPPVITGIARVVPDNQGLDAANDVNLPLIVDGDPATFWGNQVYASDTFGGLATSLALVVELEQDSTISQVTIDQLNGAGGTFSVFVNDQPTIEGAEQIAQSAFTAPTVTLPVPAGESGPRTARYVIVDVTQLPRLSDIQAQYPFGLRIAEISVS